MKIRIGSRASLERTASRHRWFAWVGAVLALLAVTDARAGTLTSTLGPVPPTPSPANGYEFTATAAYPPYQASLPGSMRFTAGSAIELTLDAAAHEVSLRSMVLDAGTVRVAGLPIHHVQVVAVFSGSTSFSFDPASGAFSTTIFPTLFADIPGYGDIPLAYGFAELSGTFRYQGSLDTGPVTMSLQATGRTYFEAYYYLAFLIDGALSVDLASTVPAYPDGELEGRVVLPPGPGAGEPVAGAWVGNFGLDGASRADGGFSFAEWPRQLDPTWVYAGVRCGPSWVLGSSARTRLASGGVTEVGSLALRGAPGRFVAASPLTLEQGATELVAAFDQTARPNVVASVRRADGSHHLRFARNDGGGSLLLYADLDAQGEIRRDLLAYSGVQQPIVLYPNATREAVSIVWPRPDLISAAGPLHVPAGGPAVALRVGNVTKAAGPDLFVALEDAATGDGRLVVVPSITPGQWGDPVVVHSASGPIHAIEARALDGDGFDDVVVAEAAGVCRVLRSSGPAGFVVAQSVACPLDARSALAQDLDGDGDWDLAFAGDANASGGGRVTVLRNDAGALTPIHADVGQQLSALESAAWMVAGKRAFVAASPGDHTIYVIAEDGLGGFAPVAAVPAGDGTAPSSVAAADLDDDGFDDLIATTGAASLARWQNELQPGDGDGDGLDDLAELASGLACADGDSDGDGFADGADLCPVLATAAQPDGDGDGVGDECDNCAAAHNPDQADGDGDGLGDACEGGTVTRRFAPEAGRTNELTLSMGNFLGALETRTAQVLPASFVELTVDPVANRLTLQDLEIAFSELHYFGLLNIALIQPTIVLASAGGPRTVAVDPATGEFSFDLLVVGLDVLVGTQPQLPGGLLTLGGRLSGDGTRLADVYVGFVTMPLTAFLGPYYLVGPGTLNFVAP